MSPRAAPPLPAWLRRAAPLLALMFSGSIQVQMSAPASWWWFTPVYLVPGFFVISRRQGRRAFLGGWLMGAAANATIFYWIVHTVREFSNLPTPVAVLVLGLFAAVFGLYNAVFAWGWARVRRVCGAYWPVGIAAWWVACEFLNPQLFPYYQGVIFYQQPWFFLITSVTGVSGVSFQIVLWNVLGVWLIERWQAGEPLRDRSLVRVASIAAACVAVTLLVSRARLVAIEKAEATADTRRLALVQTNLDVRSAARLARQGPTAVLDAYLETSRRAWAADPEIDVFIWPEGALPGAPMMRRNRALLEFVYETGVEVWTGGDFYRRSPGGLEQYNAAYRVFGQAEVDERYDKNILLPFGEFMPLKSVFPILGEIKGVGHFVPGNGLTVYDAPAGRFCFLICYEAIRHAYVRTGVRQDLDLLVNITYDAWFGDTNCAEQHLMLAAIQSAQYGVPLARAATTGISALVDARGVIRQETEVFVPAVLVGDVERVRVPSVYTRVGDTFAWSCVLGSAALLLRGRRRRKRA